MQLIDKAKAAREASILLAAVDSETKNAALQAIAKALEANKASIFTANEEDCTRSEKEEVAGPLLKRLLLNETKLPDVIAGVMSLSEMADPVGKTQLATQLDEGLELYKVSCPIGVIGTVFEARPDALVQIAVLALKSGNSVILKGGSEAQLTNRALFEIIEKAAEKAGIPSGWIQLAETRGEVGEMLKLSQYIDLLIPRGSNAFVTYIMENSSIPVLGHADGVCTIYIDKECDKAKIPAIVYDAKTQYVAACNTVENILVHADVAAEVLPQIKEAFTTGEVTVKMVGCEKTCAILGIDAATEEDWSTEYGDYTIAIKVIDSLETAVAFINKYGSGHTDSILTENEASAKYFMSYVDAACVFQNCSTRFSDGFRFGFGAEVGVSTSKMHARGPVGLEGLLIYKYKLIGNGQTAAMYASGEKTYTHAPLNGNSPL